jgi:hypothetical protein
LFGQSDDVSGLSMIIRDGGETKMAVRHAGAPFWNLP